MAKPDTVQADRDKMREGLAALKETDGPARQGRAHAGPRSDQAVPLRPRQGRQLAGPAQAVRPDRRLHAAAGRFGGPPPIASSTPISRGQRRGPSRPDRRRAVGRRRRAVRRDLCAARHRLHAGLRRDAQDQPVLRGGLDRRRLCEPADPRRHQGARRSLVFLLAAAAGGAIGGAGLSRRLQVHSARQSAGDPDVDGRPAAADRRDHRAHDGGRAAQLSGAVLRRDRPARAVQPARRPDVRLRARLRLHGGAAAAALPHQARPRDARRLAAAGRQRSSAASASRA